jgi:hypothetical protein
MSATDKGGRLSSRSSGRLPEPRGEAPTLLARTESFARVSRISSSSARHVARRRRREAGGHARSRLASSAPASASSWTAGPQRATRRARSVRRRKPEEGARRGVRQRRTRCPVLASVKTDRGDSTVTPLSVCSRSQISQREFTEKAWEAVVSAPEVARSFQQQVSPYRTALTSPLSTGPPGLGRTLELTPHSTTRAWRRRTRRLWRLSTL